MLRMGRNSYSHSFWPGITCGINILESNLLSVSHKIEDAYAYGSANLFLEIVTTVILTFLPKCICKNIYHSATYDS